MAAKKKPESARELVELGNSLLGRYGAANQRKCEALFEKAIALEPDNLDALYYLAWSLDRYNTPPTAKRVAALCTKIVALTAHVAKPAKRAKEPSLEERARSFALAWGLPLEVTTKLSLAAAERLLATASEAYALRATPMTEHAMLAADAACAFARASKAKKPELGYEWLLEWVEKHPVHSSYLYLEADETNKGITLARGLEAFFEDPGFVEWARRQKPRARAVPSKVSDRAVAYAAGYDQLKHAHNVKEPKAFGRLGRLLALRALGCSLESRMPTALGGSDEWGTVEVAALAAPHLLPSLVEMGLSLDEGVDGCPPLIALTKWGGLDAIRAVLKAGANPAATNKKKKTAADIAREIKSPKALKLLKAR